MHLPHLAGQRNLIVLAVLATLTLGAMLLVWRASDQRQREQITRLSNRLSSTQAELQFAKGRAQLPPPEVRTELSRGVLTEIKLPFINLKSATITAGELAFQASSFNHGDLSDCVISAGHAAFQRTHFDNANVTNAKLTGGVGAFMLASFENADLSGATLTGVGGAFQCMSLAGAKAIGTTFRCGGGAAFQGVNIDATQFAGADLSSIDQQSLESCYFQTAPSYDEQTQFPGGFDPVAQGWTKVPDQ